jgi:hypothetical protein
MTAPKPSISVTVCLLLWYIQSYGGKAGLLAVIARIQAGNAGLLYGVGLGFILD